MIYEKMTIFEAVSEKKYEIDTVKRQQFAVTVKSWGSEKREAATHRPFIEELVRKFFWNSQ